MADTDAAAGPANLKSADDEDPSPNNSSSNNMADARYFYDEEKLEALKKEAPWMKNAKFFQKVAVSPAAVMKIMQHCQSGCDKGIAQGSNPIEVMGILLGRPDHDETLTVTDAFPLPIEGFETRVIADDEGVANHMISLGESLETTRKERFMGWYHSHPFDVAEHSHCFLSQTDLSTQLQWQRAEDPHGNPFVAIVVDPLRSAHTGIPELKAFRAYPPEYNSPVTNECPDGSVEALEQQRLELWGSCWNRYYELKVEYYMSAVSRKVLSSLTQDYLWIRTLTNQPESKLTGKLNTIVNEFEAAAKASTNNAASSMLSSSVVPPAVTAAAARGRSISGGSKSGGGGGGKQSSQKQAAVNTTMNARTKGYNKAINHLADAASEQFAETTLVDTKKRIFS